MNLRSKRRLSAGNTKTLCANSKVGLDQEWENTFGAGQMKRRGPCGHPMSGMLGKEFAVLCVAGVRQCDDACAVKMLERITAFVADRKRTAWILRAIGFMPAIVHFVLVMAFVTWVYGLRRFVRSAGVGKHAGNAKCREHLQSPDGYNKHGQSALHGFQALSAPITTDSYCGWTMSLSAL